MLVRSVAIGVLLTLLVAGCLPIRNPLAADREAPVAVGTPGLEVDAPRQDAPAPAACQASLQALVDVAPAGSTLNVPPCLARETVVVRKPLAIDGAKRAEVRGSDVWSDWAAEGSAWISAQAVPPLRTDTHVECVADRCQWPEQVFVDGQPLEQIADGARPDSGQFALDGRRRVVLADDPTGHSVEVTVRPRWFDVQSDGVTIEGFTMRHAASAAQHGAVGNQDRSQFVLQDNILSDTHAAVVSIGGGRDARVERNDISRGGQAGISGYKNTETLIRGNRIHDNNTEGFKPDWEGGGVKLVSFDNVVVDANEVYANYGPGLWCDIGCRAVTFSNNRVHGNAGAGIFFEISQGADIVRNVVWSTPTSVWPGILVSSSADASVRDNVVAWSPVGITVQLDDRADRPASAGTGTTVERNTILASRREALAIEWVQHGSGRVFEPDARNSGAFNSYWYPSDEDGRTRFAWRSKLSRLDQFNRTPGGREGRYLSTSERDGVLAANSVPPYR